MHGGATMTTKSGTMVCFTGLTLLMIVIATVISAKTGHLLISNCAIGSGIVFILGSGFGFLLEQNEKKES